MDVRPRRATKAILLVLLGAVLLGLTLFLVFADPFGDKKDVSISVIGDSESSPGTCSVFVSGSPFNGEGLTEEAAVVPVGGSTTKSLPPGRYVANAYCDREDGSLAEGKVGFAILATAVKVTIDIK